MQKENKHVKKFRENHLKPTEKIIAFAEGYIGEMMGKGKDAQHNGSLIITETLVIFYRKGLFGEVLETIPLKSITSIERKSSILSKTIRLHASHDDLTFKSQSMDKNIQQEIIDAIELGRSSTSTDSPVVTISNTEESPIEKIKKLGELKEAGILTEAEFENKKTELLASF